MWPLGISNALNGAHQIDQAVTFEVLLATERSRAFEEDPLHVFWALDELATDGKEGRDRAGDVRCGHARPTVIHVGAHVGINDDSKFFALRLGCAGRNALARSDEIGFESSIACWSL